VLAYQHSAAGLRQLTWIDRNGKGSGNVGAPGYYYGPSLSPDGGKLAVEIEDPKVQGSSDIWIYDLNRNFRTRLTFAAAHEHNFLPVWSPDGKQIAFTSNRGQQTQRIYVKPVSGNEPERMISPSQGNWYPTSWSPDGEYIAGVQQDPQRGVSFMLLPVLHSTAA